MKCIEIVITLVITAVLKRTNAVKVELPSALEAADDGEWRKAGNSFYICTSVGSGSSDDSPLILGYQKVQPASEVYVKVSYMIRECSACTYAFDVSVFRTDRKFEKGFPKFTDHAYTSVGKLVNHTAMKKGDKNKPFTSVIIINTEDTMGIYLAFSPGRTCGGITAIEIWYLSCQSSADQLLTFPEQPAPSSNKSVIRVQGRCIDNSVAVSSAKDNVMMCYANGTSKISGGCQCQAGYYMNGNHQCLDCPPKTFKPFAGNRLCLNCTNNVKDGLLPRMSLCECLSGYFRPVGFVTNLNAECEAPPSSPRELNMTTIKSQWAVITWKPPKKMGTGGSVWYNVYCMQCDIHSQVTAELSFTLTNLKAYFVYNITVLAVNNVTKAIGRRNGNKLYFRTLSGLPSSVLNLKVIRNDDGSVTIKWDAPDARGGPDLRYFIEVNGGSGFFSKGNNYTFAQEEKRKEYTVFIRSHTSAGFSKTEAITFSIDGKARGIPLDIAIGVGSAFGVILIIAIICIIIFYRRRHPSHLQTVRLENGQVKLPKFSGNRLYVEPTTYQDVADAVREFAKELERNWIDFDHLIGSGEFGDVYKGTLQRPQEEKTVVAVKTLKGNANKKASDDFLSEAAYMGQFDDPNVIALEGVVVRDKPVMIVIEYMSNGSLDKFLQDNDSRLSSLQLLGMARGVSSGMTYLSEGGFIHRDLAARNILVTDNMVCKVADFGMSRELTDDDAYNTTGGKIPVRWTSPEAIQFKKFTSASDVWSYGILLWEIMSFGERPYWDWGNYEVVGRLESGYRLPPPMGCPKVVHDLMLICWQKDRIKRPKFREIRNTIDKWIRTPELLTQEASVITKRDENLDYAAMTTLKEWLDSIKMSQYLANFTSQNLVTPRQILELTENDLKELGVFAVGHRMKIMKSIKATKDQLFNNTDESNERLLPDKGCAD